MDSEMNDRVVLITGASGGIGQATARVLADEGAKLVLHYHSGREACDKLAETLDVPTLVAQANVADESSVQRLFEQALARFSRVDTIVVNAGIWPDDDFPIQDMPLEQWQKTLDVNLTGAFLTCREFFRHLKDRGEDCDPPPSVVLVASTAGIVGEAEHCDYAAAKAGMAHGLTLSLKNEIVRLCSLGRVNAVCPGWVDTPMSAKPMTVPGAVERATSTMALRKVATAEDIAQSIVFLASSRLSGHLSGTILPVAGGMEGRLLHDPNPSNQ